MTERYQSVNGAWPEHVPVPSPEEAIAGAKRLYRLVMGRAWRKKWAATSGRRHTWPRYGVFYVNPNKTGWHTGWQALVHDLSHYCHMKLYQGQRPHAGSHAWTERTMIEHVVNSGWLEGKLKRPEKLKRDVREVRAARVAARIKAWEAKRRRADNALRKLRRSANYYGVAASP